jgi:cyclophilin family peptidyl-prolyl cis-trans isomerase
MMIPTIDGETRQAGVLTNITVNNSGTAEWVTEFDEIDPENLELLQFNLPLGFTDLSVESDLPSGLVLETDDGFVMTNAIPPGESSILVSYIVPYAGDGFSFIPDFQLRTDTVRMLLWAGGGSIASEFLQLIGSETIDDEVFIYAEGGPVVSSDSLSISFARLPEPSLSAVPNSVGTTRPPPEDSLGSDDWWEYVAAAEDYELNIDTVRSGKDESLKRIYASMFAARSWLAGIDPWQNDFGEFVRSISYENMPAKAASIFDEVLQVEETEKWIRPYQQPTSIEEFSFAVYIIWGACLLERSWDECEVSIGETIVEYLELVGNSADSGSVTESSGIAKPYIPSFGMLEVGDTARAPSGALELSSTYEATFITEAGVFTVLLFDDEAPLTVENFINLATIGYYDGTMFHRVIPNFMAQGGDPQGTGAGGPGYRFRDEFDTTLRHNKPGILSMANSGRNTNGSQFFITFVATPHLDDVHTVFGEVIDGIENVFDISARDPGSAQFAGDLIKSISISQR